MPSGDVIVKHSVINIFVYMNFILHTVYYIYMHEYILYMDSTVNYLCTVPLQVHACMFVRILFISLFKCSLF
jgi:hypothetical protein